MRKLVVVAGSLVALFALAYGITVLLASRAEQRSEDALRRLAATGPVQQSKADLSTKNQLAEELESLTQPLGIDLEPKHPGRVVPASQLSELLVRSMSDWLRAQEENPTDAIDPLPADIRAWLDLHRSDVEDAAGALVARGAPRWPDGGAVPAIDRPIPNLLGHMHLYRVLHIASLERETAGDHAGAWRLQQAAWHLTEGLLERREVISALIGIAGVRMAAAVQRKLEAPVPPWVAEMSRRRMHHELIDAIRDEAGVTSEVMRRTGALDVAGLEHEPGAATMFAAAATSPFVRWAVAENTTVAMQQLATVRDVDPCMAATRPFDREIEQKVTPLARNFGGLVLPNLTSGIARAAFADVEVEGTSKVLAAKAARAATPDGTWPAAVPGVERSRCAGARWVYSVDPEGSMSLRFEGEVPAPPGPAGAKIPFEYRDTAATASSAS